LYNERELKSINLFLLQSWNPLTHFLLHSNTTTITGSSSLSKSLTLFNFNKKIPKSIHNNNFFYSLLPLFTIANQIKQHNTTTRCNKFVFPQIFLHLQPYKKIGFYRFHKKLCSVFRFVFCHNSKRGTNNHKLKVFLEERR